MYFNRMITDNLTYLDYNLIRLAVIDKVNHLKRILEQGGDYKELLAKYEELKGKLDKVVKIE